MSKAVHTLYITVSLDNVTDITEKQPVLSLAASLFAGPTGRRSSKELAPEGTLHKKVSLFDGCWLEKPDPSVLCQTGQVTAKSKLLFYMNI